jgi:hypothetical protein
MDKTIWTNNGAGWVAGGYAAHGMLVVSLHENWFTVTDGDTYVFGHISKRGDAWRPAGTGMQESNLKGALSQIAASKIALFLGQYV